MAFLSRVCSGLVCIYSGNRGIIKAILREVSGKVLPKPVG